MFISFLSSSPRLSINFTAFHAVWKTPRTTWPQSDRHPQKYSKRAGTSAKDISGSPYLMHKDCCTGGERTQICLGYLFNDILLLSSIPFQSMLTSINLFIALSLCFCLCGSGNFCIPSSPQELLLEPKIIVYPKV